MRASLLILVFFASMSSLSLATTQGFKGERSGDKLEYTEVQPLDSVTNSDLNCGRLTARSLFYVCNRIPDENLQAQCFSAGRNAYLDQCALGACDRYSSSQGTIGCVASIANRIYILQEILDCDSLASEAASNQCFATAGQYQPGSDQSDEVRRLRHGILDARDAIDRQDYINARRILDGLIR